VTTYRITLPEGFGKTPTIGPLEKVLKTPINKIQVIEGRVPARRLDVIKSAKRIAWILHQQGNRTRAWQAYKEIESFTASDLVRAQCLAERAGIVFELARGAGKANFSEVEHFCNCSLRNIPEEFTKQHALIMVIKTELLMTLREWHKALNICEQIISLYKNNPECRREYAITLCHSGWLNLWFNKITTAEQCFQRIYAEIPTIKESFAGYNFFAEANLGLAFIKNRLKERGTAIKMAEEIILKFPNTQTS
ncbi:MAG: hypothetical protein N2246_03250, partial [Candidatus Sumerlaeia bacterium]|nr:hypothetical protein [Candidatus Sumerlaeia bacterium]